MARRKNWSAEQIVASLRQIEVQMAQGKSLALACKEAEISEQSYYRWRKEYGGVAVEQAKRLKDLERETPACAGSWRISHWRSRSSRMSPRETCKP